MPYYRITIIDIYSNVKQGIRFDAMTDIDAYYGKAYHKAVMALKNKLKSVDVVMLTTNCEEVKKHLEKNRNKNSVVWDGKPIEYKGKQKFDAYNQDKKSGNI